MVQAEIRRSGFEELLGAGIVLTGGSAKMDGMVELAEEVFLMPVRTAVPHYVGGLSEVVRNPIFSTAVGLVLFGQRHRLGLQQDRSVRVEVSNNGLPGTRLVSPIPG
ncbi:MAG: hypothetical protein CM1200mP41_23770 [Gammaproteobacteria bacterium]|nr:MAG: hypothetical protein CM1200mP41_23770 [Gammaproteobacteria bacterium]